MSLQICSLGGFKCAVIDAFTSWQRTGIEDDPHHQVFLCTLVRCNYTETFQGPPYTLSSRTT